MLGYSMPGYVVFILGMVSGVVAFLSCAWVLLWFVDTYRIKDISEGPHAVKKLVLEMVRLGLWSVKIRGKLEPIGTIPVAGDVVMYRGVRLVIERVDDYFAYARMGDHPRINPHDSFKIASRHFLGFHWDSVQWRIKKRPPVTDTKVHWWLECTVKELMVDSLLLPDPNKGRPAFKPWPERVNPVTNDDEYCGTLL